MQKIVWRAWLNYLLKLLISLALIWALYEQLAGRIDAASLRQTLRDLWSGPNRYWLGLVLLLMPLNWLFELWKWQVFIPRELGLSFRRLMLAVFSGITFSLFTPNRLGDYLGRILLVRAEANWSVFVATLAASLCQLLVLLAFGLVGLLIFVPNQLRIEWQYYKVFLILASLGTIILGLFVFNFRRLVGRLLRWNSLRGVRRRIKKYLYALRTYNPQTFARAIAMAALRYGVYSSQYYFMLRFAGIPVAPEMAYAGIATIFLVQTSIPLPPALGLLARGEIALLVWSGFTEEPTLILAASYGLFIINLTLPSLLGLVAILRINILKSLGYE